MIGADGKENIPHADWLRTFGLVVDQFKKEHPGFFGAKVWGFLSGSCLSVTNYDSLR